MSSGGTKQEDPGSRSCNGPSRPFHLHPALHSHFIPLFLPHRRRAPLTPSVTKEQGRKSSGGEMRGKGREGEEEKRSEEERSENGEMKGGRREEKKKQKEQQGEPINHQLTPTPPLIDCCRCVRACASCAYMRFLPQLHLQSSSTTWWPRQQFHTTEDSVV